MQYSLTCGVFDCLHEGHINLFKLMKQEADRVVVALHDDKSTFENKGRFPVQDYDHRQRNLLMCGYVDMVFETKRADPSIAFVNVIGLYKPVVYMRGDDWPEFPGRDVVERLKIPVKLVAYTRGVSTTKIRGETER